MLNFRFFDSGVVLGVVFGEELRLRLSFRVGGLLPLLEEEVAAAGLGLLERLVPAAPLGGVPPLLEEGGVVLEAGFLEAGKSWRS